MPYLSLFERLERHLLQEFDKAERGEPSGFNPRPVPYAGEQSPVYTLTLPNNVDVQVCMTDTVHWFEVLVNRKIRLKPGEELRGTYETAVTALLRRANVP